MHSTNRKIFTAAVLLLIGVTLGFYFYRKAPSNSRSLSSYDFDVSKRALDGDQKWNVIRNILIHKKPQTIDQFLQILKDEKLVSFESYSLVHRTRSKQLASLLDPRVILSSDSGDLMLSFNGDPKLSGYGSLELVTYQPQKEAFQFRDIIFLNEASKDDFEKLSADDIEEKTQTHWISKSNPGVCMDCHSTNYSFDAKPIWDAYFLWPGVYGAVDDELNILRRLFKEQSQDEKETDNVKAFQLKVITTKHKRYKLLTPINVAHRLGRAQDSLRPNMDLTLKIHYMMGRRAARQICENPQWRPYRYAILAILACDKFYETESFRNLVSDHDFSDEKIIAYSKQVDAKINSHIRNQLHDILNKDFQKQELVDPAILKFLAEHYSVFNVRDRPYKMFLIDLLGKKVGWNTEDWSAIFDGVTGREYDGNADVSFIKGFAKVLFANEQSNNTDLRFVLDELFSYTFQQSYRKYCEVLKKASDKELK